MEKFIKLLILRTVIIYSFSLFAEEMPIIENRTDITNYRTYEEILSELQKLENDYPDICKLYDIGDTWGKIYSDAGKTSYDAYNHEIWALKVSDNVGCRGG